ncbi:MAG: hypothetical protein ACJ76H_13025 [Bacteriovoracaceae bacterium]
MKLLLLSFFVSLSAFATMPDFPQGPDARLTTGSLCDMPTEYRYPEHIAYCERNVDTSTKNDIFVAYRKLGYRLPSQTRADYKIDHYIPLCMGGANHTNNLWPQHVTIYKQTDSLEEAICAKMNEGKIHQADAVKMMKAVKNNLSLLKQAFAQLNAL